MNAVTIGRSRSNRIVLPKTAQNVSRHHAVLQPNADESYTLTDQSQNGTSVNGQQIPKGKPFFIYRGDQVRFANEVLLDWDKVPAWGPAGQKARGWHQTLGNASTHFARDLRDLLGEVTEASERLVSIRTFFRFLRPSGRDEVVQMSFDVGSKRPDPVVFFTVGLGLLAFFVLLYVKVGGYVTILKNEFTEGFGEVIFALILVTLVFVWAVFLYKVFKNYFKRPDVRWIHYKRLYLLSTGFAFLGLALCQIPAIVSAMIGIFLSGFEPKSAAPQPIENSGMTTMEMVYYGFNLVFAAWLAIFILRVHQRFWRISYIATAIILFFGISSFSLIIFVLPEAVSAI